MKVEDIEKVVHGLKSPEIEKNSEVDADVNIRLTSVLPTTYIDGALYIMSLLRRHSHEIS